MLKDIYNNRILIIDFGSQYTQLIARRIREIGVYCKVFDWDITEKKIKEFKPKGIILSGGPDSVTKFNSPRVPDCVFNISIPVLGICYGMQVISVQLGGSVEVSDKREFGNTTVEIIDNCKLFNNISDGLNSNGISKLDVWMSHGDNLITIPSGFKSVARTTNCPYAVIANDEKKIYGVQFHPEVTHTVKGKEILLCFVKNICCCDLFWKSSTIIENIIFRLKKQIGCDNVLLAFSGGLDSSVTALLLNLAIGKQLTCVFIDNGLLRSNKNHQIIKDFSSRFKLNIVYVESEKRFFNTLIGVFSPEEKRKKIGNMFIEILNEISITIPNTKWLAQGTIYSDIIESAASKIGKSDVIKSHHNVGGLPLNMKLRLVEPLKNLFKDEVIKIGIKLGLNDNVLYQHPFPGPGLAIRILGEVKKEYCDLLRKADKIFIDELYKSNLYYKISQAFAIFLPVRSVGVMGDSRKYDWVICLRAIKTVDFMTANWVELPYSFLKIVSNRIINEIDGISRVVYDISNKPPSTIEWE